MSCRANYPIENFLHLLANPVTFGFLISLSFNSERRCEWEEDDTSESASILSYFWKTYYFFHVFTWFVVFSYLYQNIIITGFHIIISFLGLGLVQEKCTTLCFALLFGFVVGGEILGGWCDLERFKECIESEEMVCESVGIRFATRCVQSVCDRLTLSYDADKDVYVGGKSGMCLYIFRYCGHFIMTFLSTLFTIFLICM